MTERLRTVLLVATLVAATIGAAAAIVRLAPAGGAHPAVMIVRPGRAPVQWHGWELIPPAESGACEKEGYDACSDDPGGGDDGLDASDDNGPVLI
jgi:hypothetical protein